MIDVVNNFTLDYIPSNEIRYTNNFTQDYVPYDNIKVKDYYYPIGNSILTEPSGVVYGQVRMGLDERWDKIFKKYDSPSLYTMMAAGHFAITREGILCKPLSFYENIKNMLETEGEVVPYEIERLEAYIFNPLYI